MLTLVLAHNEADTIANVVQALLPAMGRVIVVDDGSTDGTRYEAEWAGAEIVETPHNLGKGGAMKYALDRLPRDDVAFFDADLVGFKSEYARNLVNVFKQGYDMVCMLREEGHRLQDAMMRVKPLLTGERIVRRWAIDTVPFDCWNGYVIETALNDAVSRGGGRTAILSAPYHHRSRLEKNGTWNGTKSYRKMFSDISKAKDALDRTGGTSCNCQIDARVVEVSKALMRLRGR
jgi:glycosyltransferase involved in cell wall biosynthesis